MRYVTLKQLRALVQVVKTGSFAAAAEALHVTPPAVTVQMRQLEEAAGMPVIDRTHDGIELTDAGREVLATAERIETALADCTSAIESLKGLKQGRVAVGVISTAKYFAPKALAAFTRTHPGIELKLTIGNRQEIVAALAARTLDVAIMGRPPEGLAVDRAMIGDHPHVLIAAPDHPLAGRDDIRPQELSGETFLVREPGSGTRELMERYFAGHELELKIGMEIGSNETIKQAVIAGLGISFISGHTIAAELADGRLVALQLRGLPIIRQWFVVHLAERRLSPAPRALNEFLVKQGRSFLPKLPMLST